MAEEINLDQLAASTEEAPVIKLANLIIVQAIKDRASDIHIEPFEKALRLRYRVDGVLLDAMPPPKQMQLALASRFKIMSFATLRHHLLGLRKYLLNFASSQRSHSWPQNLCRAYDTTAFD